MPMMHPLHSSLPIISPKLTGAWIAAVEILVGMATASDSKLLHTGRVSGPLSGIMGGKLVGS